MSNSDLHRTPTTGPVLAGHFASEIEAAPPAGKRQPRLGAPDHLQHPSLPLWLLAGRGPPSSLWGCSSLLLHLSDLSSTVPSSPSRQHPIMLSVPLFHFLRALLYLRGYRRSPPPSILRLLEGRVGSFCSQLCSCVEKGLVVLQTGQASNNSSLNLKRVYFLLQSVQADRPGMGSVAAGDLSS